MNTMEPIRLVFTFNRQVLKFVVLNREIFYSDKVWSNWIRVVPMDQKVINQIRMSRNKIPKELISMFTLSKAEMEEYDNAKDDEALAKIVINDCKKKGVKFEKRT